MATQRCTYCGSGMHTIEHCPKTFHGSGNRKRIKCIYCGSCRHYRDACPKTVAPHNWKPGRWVGD